MPVTASRLFKIYISKVLYFSVVSSENPCCSGSVVDQDLTETPRKVPERLVRYDEVPIKTETSVQYEQRAAISFHKRFTRNLAPLLSKYQKRETFHSINKQNNLKIRPTKQLNIIQPHSHNGNYFRKI